MSAVETVKTLITALQSGDMTLAANTMTDDFTISGMTPHPLNKEEYLAMQSELLAGMPDFSYNLDNVRKEGDNVKSTITVTGTHTNELSMPRFGFPPVPATGLAVVLPQTEVEYRVKDDRVASMQLAAVPGGALTGLIQQIGSELPIPPREENIGTWSSE